jgi:hypothetical protein
VRNTSSKCHLSPGRGRRRRAQSTLVGIELMHMLRKQQLEDGVEQGLTAAEQFSSLAA